jgi:F-type H+-transporting ATPase subunit gamma
MANLKELRTRISSVKTTMQMTSAMKMVSAAKLRKAQNAILQLRPYASKIHNLLVDMLSVSSENDSEIYFKSREVKRVLIVVISSNRGLCGAFNSNVEKYTFELIKKYQELGLNPNNIEVYTFGKKAFEGLKRRNCKIIKSDFNIFENLNYENVLEISTFLTQKFKEGYYDNIEIIYNSFKNAATQILVKEHFLPLEMPKQKNVSGDYIYEPTSEKIVEKLIPEALTMQIYKSLLESFASEHGARMTAMHKATDNASELIYELTLNYNKARQASITKEILEIVGGAEALKS